MILFYRDCFFPAGHVDEGKPIPLGLSGQLGSRPHFHNIKALQDTPKWLEYKSLMLELGAKGYSHTVRNSDDPVQIQLQERLNRKQIETDSRTFEELYRIGLARLGIAPPPSTGWLPQATQYLHQAADLLSAVNHFQQGYQQLRAASGGALPGVGAALQFRP